MSGLLAIITAVLTALGVKIPPCLGTSDPTALQRYAKRMYNSNQDRFRPLAMDRVTNEVEIAAGNQQKAIDFTDAHQTAYCILKSLVKGAPESVAGVCSSANTSSGVPVTDPIAMAAAQAAADFGVNVE